MKITIEIEDNLQEVVDSCCEEVKDLLIEYIMVRALDEDDDVPDINDLDYSGAVHEIIDGAVPIHTKEIDGLWYLYGNEFEESYENAGIGNNPRENNGMTAIFCYLREKVNEWYDDNAESIFQENCMKEGEEEDQDGQG